MEMATLGLCHRSGGKVCLIARFKSGCCIVRGVNVGNMGLEVILLSVAFVYLHWGSALLSSDVGVGAKLK